MKRTLGNVIALLAACCFSMHSAVAEQSMSESANNESVPSAEFLQFLLEFDEADEETFDMMIENGIRDQEQTDIDDFLDQDRVDNPSDTENEV